MPNYKIPQRKVPVTLYLRTGSPRPGVLFVPQDGPGGGPVRLLDRLNDPHEHFLALSNDGAARLISRDWIVRIDLADAADAALEVEPETNPAIMATASMADETLLEGRLVFSMPPARARLIDYLNSHEGFVPMHVGVGISLIHLRNVIEWEAI